MPTPNPYSTRYHSQNTTFSLESAKEIVPLLLKLIEPGSVIDVGCGLGSWLSIFQKHHISDILGVDGDFISRRSLLIPEKSFLAHDLTSPLELERKFDLVLSLEVAEHLPEKIAGVFVQSLVDLGEVILFSAAIPFQGGTGHINEKWQDYWAERFSKHGYKAVDCIRPRIWNMPNVASYYAQNILLYVKESKLDKYVHLMKRVDPLPSGTLSIVHPRMWLQMADPKQRRFSRSMRELSTVLMASISRKLRMFRKVKR